MDVFILVHSTMSLEKLVGQLLLLVLPRTYCISEVVSVSQLAWPIVSCCIIPSKDNISWVVYGFSVW